MTQQTSTGRTLYLQQ